MRATATIRLIAACVLAFYVMMPHAVAGFTVSGCVCVEDGLKCGKGGVVCHCCKEKNSQALGGTVIAKCRSSASEYNIAHPPAVFGSTVVRMSEPLPETVVLLSELSFNETTIAPPLRPPEPLPSS